MKDNKVKRAIYLRIFTGLFAIYLLLMAGFSIYLIEQTKKVESLDFRAAAIQHKDTVEMVLQDYLDSHNRVNDIVNFRRDLAFRSHSFTFGGRELALYTGDYHLVYHTNYYWVCEFVEYTDGSRYYSGRAYLNPRDWFSEQEVAELEGYLSKHFLTGTLKPVQAGDLAGYSVDLDGFWLHQEMIIPRNIVVTPVYAERLDEEKNLIPGKWEEKERVVYVAKAGNPRDLPYFERGSINAFIFWHKAQLNKEKQVMLRNVVLDQEKLKQAIEQLKKSIEKWGGNQVLSERTRFLNYQYYMVLPYQKGITVLPDDSFYSDFWTVMAGEVDLWEKNAGTLAFVWLSCFLAFLVVALILANQTYRTYQKGKELERHRRELTYALAHDLKTPLSIISGYAQNLMENVRTEKREHYAVGIREKVEQMDGIIREMLDLFRLEAAVRPVVDQEAALGAICREVIGRYEELCRERSIEVLLEGDQIIKADPALIKRVIDNFFVNALAHTPNKGRIRICIWGDTLEFFNSGSHIPEEKLDEIWQPYRKADESRSTTKGTGLGLAIASRILEAHEFSYGARNSEDGVIFWFRFA